MSVDAGTDRVRRPLLVREFTLEYELSQWEFRRLRQALAAEARQHAARASVLQDIAGLTLAVSGGLSIAVAGAALVEMAGAAVTESSALLDLVLAGVAIFALTAYIVAAANGRRAKQQSLSSAYRDLADELRSG